LDRLRQPKLTLNCRQVSLTNAEQMAWATVRPSKAPKSPTQASKQSAGRLVSNCARMPGGVASLHPRATWGMSA